MNNGIPRKLITPQNVSCDFAVAATITEIPENPNENKITIAIMGTIKIKSVKFTPIANAIPKTRLAWSAAINEIASIFPNAIDEREIGAVNALFIKPYLLSQSVLTPPKILVKIAVSIITPGVINSIYSPSNPTDWINGWVPANVLPITIIHMAGWINLINTPLLDFL